jgi:hypothetical protein
LAIIKCSECSKDISDKAQHCIHCGAPIERDLADGSQSNQPAAAHPAPPQKEAGTAQVDRVAGTITKINSSMHEGKSLAEILIVRNTGESLSTGLKAASEIRPYSWSVGDYVSFVVEGGQAKDLLKSSKPSGSVSAGHNTQTSERNPDDKRVTKKYIWQITLLVLVAGYWIAKGTPNPALFFNGTIAKKECLELANDNRGNFVIPTGGEIRANDTWIQGGKRIVQLIQESDGNMQEIMCVVGNGMVRIPSVLEQARWR